METLWEQSYTVTDSGKILKKINPGERITEISKIQRSKIQKALGSNLKPAVNRQPGLPRKTRRAQYVRADL